jgi:hypothetical protein
VEEVAEEEEEEEEEETTTQTASYGHGIPLNVKKKSQNKSNMFKVFIAKFVFQTNFQSKTVSKSKYA